MEYEKKIKSIFKDSNIAFTQQEIDGIDYADFGLNNIREEGLNLIVYINNDRYCAKEMALLAGQTCPEHRHPRRGKNLEIEGKEETFRVRQGQVYLYVEGEKNVEKISARLPEKNKEWYTAIHEIVLNAGEQYTISPNTRHWFQAGEEGAIISEFSSPSDDSSDIFTNPNIKR
ncbi:D-lyxose/D-mannose family sugar isomerase [Lactococcus lactis]|jgi:D-lyxose ketol-isomerase|uniref:D-lyxose/D-mannose family sugar isomerase n=1 Tax=Lactococcus lactis TaxID=1358 RepID=UPI0038D104E1